MILDSNTLKDVDVTNSYVVGRAIERTNILREDERVMLFDGVRTALNYINDNLDKPKHNGSSEHSGGHAGNTFRSYAEAMDIFLNRPSEVVKYDPTEMRPFEWAEQGNDLEYDVTGDFIDVGRVLEGVPEHFGSLHNGNPRSRRVRLVVGLAQTHYMTPREIDHRSERIVRLIDALENANIRTEFTAIDSNECSHTEITVKRFDEPLTIEDVAVVTHTEFFRRMLFRASEWSDTWRGGYGDTSVLRRNVKTLESQLNDELSVYIDGDILMNNIDNHFNKLEKMLEEELSRDIPQMNLVWLNNSGIGSSNIAEKRAKDLNKKVKQHDDFAKTFEDFFRL